LTEEQLVAERRGAVGWVFNHQLGINAAITSRTAIGGAVVDTILEYATEPQEAYKILLGPSASVYDGTLGVVEAVSSSAKVAYRAEDMNLEDYGSLMSVIADAALQLPSSTRNATMAWALQNGKPFRTKSNKFVFQEDQNVQTIVFQALGFGNQDLADYWELTAAQSGGSSGGRDSYEMRKRDAVTMITNMYLGLMKSAETEQEQVRAYELGISTFVHAFEDQKDRMDIMDGVRTRLQNARDPIGKQVMKILENATSELALAGAKFNPLVVRKHEEAEIDANR
jgi:hypothetical protein